MSFYRRHLLPHLINCACGVGAISKQRSKLVLRARGVVLELGFGSGLNLPFYNAARVERVYGLEPEEGMLVLARRAAANANVPVEVLAETAETMSLPAQSVDTVLVTFSLCTIRDPHAALEGARRVLKPGGALLFCEHGLAPDPGVQRQQRAIEPLWKRLAGGCHLTRDIPALVRGAGFQIDDLEARYMPATPRFAGYNVLGCAAPGA